MTSLKVVYSLKKFEGETSDVINQMSQSRDEMLSFIGLPTIKGLESKLLELKEERTEKWKVLKNTTEIDEKERINKHMKEIDA